MLGIPAGEGTKAEANRFVATLSTTFHPQTDAQTERLNQILEDMLGAFVLEFSESWDSHLHLMEFAYNNSYQATIGMTPFEALYGRCCRSPVCWGEKSYADERRKDLKFDVGDMVFLKVAPMKGVLRFEKKGKLSPRFVGSFEILEWIGLYIADPTYVVDFESLHINENLSYEEQPLRFWQERSRCSIIEESHWSKFFDETTELKRPHGRGRMI
ncbi:pol protein [Cucumis melo var. makuwa]|uniref:Pol protein n=1 Tax=Cucumis melo var. makuwa TaxID=1194695 RepID=A0A5D3BP97_CUCMM|nr:pol protein [Cucumis melo var. makuwa]